MNAPVDWKESGPRRSAWRTHAMPLPLRSRPTERREALAMLTVVLGMRQIFPASPPHPTGAIWQLAPLVASWNWSAIALPDHESSNATILVGTRTSLVAT